MKIFLVVNKDKPNAAACAERVAQTLIGFGFECFAEIAGGFSQLSSVKSISIDEGFALCDIIVAIGGDGTIIHTAKKALQYNKPVLGINAGRLGFLAQIEAEEISLLQKLKDNDFKIAKRMMLKVTVKSANGASLQEHHALNDIAITSVDSKIVDFKTFCNHKLVGGYRADGMIFSTPTGSTAYSMSAGGPVVDPKFELILMTPVCPHTLFSRSLIFSPDVELNVKVHSSGGSERVRLSVDGDTQLEIDINSEITITRAGFYAKLIDMGEHDFYETLNAKIAGRV